MSKGVKLSDLVELVGVQKNAVGKEAANVTNALSKFETLEVG